MGTVGGGGREGGEGGRDGGGSKGGGGEGGGGGGKGGGDDGGGGEGGKGGLEGLLSQHPSQSQLVSGVARALISEHFSPSLVLSVQRWHNRGVAEEALLRRRAKAHLEAQSFC